VPDPPFKQMLAAAGEGDEAAWQRLFRALAPALLGYLRSAGAAEPEDVLSETFLQMARDIHRFEGDERGFRAWAFSIAHHRLIDASRSSARRPSDPVEDVPEPTDPTIAAEDASDVALARIGRGEVRAVLQTLAPDQRDVLLLRILGGLKIAEIAEALGKREGAVKQLQRRGLAAVQKELERRGVTL
jgi:RNA polymerase sigma-70 factor (ECF subfamily)